VLPGQADRETGEVLPWRRGMFEKSGLLRERRDGGCRRRPMLLEGDRRVLQRRVCAQRQMRLSGRGPEVRRGVLPPPYPMFERGVLFDGPLWLRRGTTPSLLP
jgi:hypothetical protein